ncbi:MAG: hypothetical protein ACK5MT_14375 [Actinomycetales bacterium]
MLEVILLIAAVAIGLIFVMRMDVTPRPTPQPKATQTPAPNSDDPGATPASDVSLGTSAAADNSIAA